LISDTGGRHVTGNLLFQNHNPPQGHHDHDDHHSGTTMIIHNPHKDRYEPPILSISIFSKPVIFLSFFAENSPKIQKIPRKFRKPMNQNPQQQQQQRRKFQKFAKNSENSENLPKIAKIP